MHLRSIKLRGFKSFPDPVEVKLEPGVAVVVGPNGSGKSNVSDAIVWAAGSLTPSEMRAEKPDDVLFGGSSTRQAAEHCEVELVFDNEDGGFGSELDYSEISIVRRLVRGGEGQYLVNRAPVRRTDLVELLADVGLGGSMHSIVSQGKVDAVLASRPEDRRALVEEAAGLGKFKRRRHRAELKLARVATQVERARDVEDEVRKRLRPLALQATAAERAEKLGHEIAGLRARIARIDVAALDARRAEADERRTAATLARRSAQERLRSVLAERESAEIELSDAAGGREAALAALYRLRGAGERLTVRGESASGLVMRLRDDLGEAERAREARTDETVRVLEEAAHAAAATARDAASRSGHAAERARHAHALLAAADRAAADEAERRLDEVRAERETVDGGIREVAGGQGAANRVLVALGAARERLTARHETAAELARRLRDEHEAARAHARSGAPSPAELEERANEDRTLSRAAATERDDLAERARSARERLAALERSLAEREGVAPAARALAAEGERLALAALEVEPGYEKAVAAALAWRASALLASDAGHALALLERARTSGLGSLSVVIGGVSRAGGAPPVPDARPLAAVVRGPEEAVGLLEGVWLVEAGRLEAVRSGVAVTLDGEGIDASRGELWFAGETGEAVLLELDARRRVLADEADELAARAQGAAREAEEASVRAAESEAAYAQVAHLRDVTLDAELLGRLAAVAEGVASATTQAVGTRRPDRGAARRAPRGRRAALAGARRGARRGSLWSRPTRDARWQRRAAAPPRQRSSSPGSAGRRSASALRSSARARTSRRTRRGRWPTRTRRPRIALAAADAARAADAALVERAPRRTALDVDLLRRLVGAAEGVGSLVERAAALASRFEAPVRARVDAGSARAGELGATLRELGAREVEVRQVADDATERLTAVEVELARLDGEASEAQAPPRGGARGGRG